MDSCVFCKILSGQFPSEKVGESEHWVAILDINPVSPGHTLVISREHYSSLPETPDPVVAALAVGVKTVAPAVLKATGCEGFNVLENNHRCAGQSVPHVHFHIIPRKTGDGVRFHWDPKKYPEGEMSKVATAIRNAMQS